VFAEPDESMQSALAKLREQLLEPQPNNDTPGYLIHVASVITEAFVITGKTAPTIVGGLAVETYTAGSYTTLDIDMIVDDIDAEKKIMSALGFSKRPGYRFYEHPSLDVFVEFPTGPLDGSRDRISEVRLEDGRVLYLIGIEDIVIDRVAAYVHWESSEDATQAVNLLIAQRGKIDLDYLHRAAEGKGLSKALADIMARAKFLEPEQ
jgi:hypothetical protein